MIDLHTEEMIYRDAQAHILSLWDADAVADGLMTLRELQTAREDVRTALLDSYPDVDGPTIANVMDDALSALDFPLHEV